MNDFPLEGHDTIGQRLRLLRERAGLSQLALSARIGLNQGQYSKWERDEAPVPPEWLGQVAAVLKVPPEFLSEVYVQRPRGRPPLPDCIKRRHQHTLELPRYDVRGSVAEMLNICSPAEHVLTRARRHLGLGQLGHLDQYFPRDSAWELLAACHILALAGALVRLTLAHLRCPLLAADRRGSLRCGQFHQRDALLLERPASVLAFFPQVWVVAPTQAEWYRLDFLVAVLGRNGAERWVDVEIDGSQHELDKSKDDRRARGLAAPRLACPLWEVERHDFGERLVTKLEAMLETAQPNFMSRTDAYDPWYRRPR